MTVAACVLVMAWGASTSWGRANDEKTATAGVARMEPTTKAAASAGADYVPGATDIVEVIRRMNMSSASAMISTRCHPRGNVSARSQARRALT